MPARQQSTVKTQLVNRKLHQTGFSENKHDNKFVFMKNDLNVLQVVFDNRLWMQTFGVYDLSVA